MSNVSRLLDTDAVEASEAKLSQVVAPTWRDDWEKFKYAKGTIAVTSAIFMAVYGLNYHLDTMSLAVKIATPIFSVLGVLFTIRSTGPINREASLWSKFRSTLFPICVFSLIDFSNIMLFFNTLLGSHSVKDSALLGLMGIAANFKAMFTRHAIEDPSWRLKFTPEQTQLRRKYALQFLLPYAAIFSSVAGIYYAASSNHRKLTVIAVEALSLLPRLGYQYMISKPAESAWSFRAKNSLGEALSMTISFLFGAAFMAYIGKGTSAFKAQNLLEVMMLKVALGSRYYYEAFVSLGSPSGYDSSQLLRWGRSKVSDLDESHKAACCRCCLPGFGNTPLSAFKQRQKQKAEAEGAAPSQLAFAEYNMPLKQARPVSAAGVKHDRHSRSVTV